MLDSDRCLSQKMIINKNTLDIIIQTNINKIGYKITKFNEFIAKIHYCHQERLIETPR